MCHTPAPQPALRSTLIKAMFAPPSDACATLVHSCADSSADSGAYYARGLFASQLVVKVGVPRNSHLLP